MKFLQALRNSVQSFESDLNNSSLFEHNGEKGEFREQKISKFLRPFLPECYSLGSGQVFSADGASSNQIDVVLYDQFFSNILFKDANSSLFPCESVYGTIEVKSDLDSRELTASIDNISSVKRLQRANSDMFDLLSHRSLRVSKAPGNTLQYDQAKRNPYLGMVFAYSAMKPEAVANKLNEYLASKQLPPDQMPDYIFAYKQGYVVSRARKNNDVLNICPIGQPFDQYAYLELGSDTLPFFFLTANISLNNIMLKAPDLNYYWQQVIKEIGEKQNKG